VELDYSSIEMWSISESWRGTGYVELTLTGSDRTHIAALWRPVHTHATTLSPDLCGRIPPTPLT
jgi:hypothetical protein